MCGITGLITETPSSSGEVIARMTNVLRHRGPDDWGYIVLDKRKKHLRQKYLIANQTAKVFLGHRRLSIVDIEGTKQPLANEDATVWITFNGEIYNYCELRKNLEQKGHKFREKGDTEVLVHLWEEYGESMLEHLVGMFAFAIYDMNQDIIFLARDRFGQKPLFYFENKSRNHNSPFFAFASELQALKQLDEFPADDLNDVAVAHYFRYGYVPSPKTVFNDVFSLLPGCYMIRKNGINSIRRYWKPEVTGEESKVDLDELQELIDRSVKARLVADVPLGVFLSGGIDSSLIAASMVKQSSEKVKSFTVGTGENWYDESVEARETAKKLKTIHHEFKVEPDFIEVTETLSKFYGQPFADFSSVLTYYVSRDSRNYVKVALAGDGGDEIFAGYGSYLNSAKYSLFGRIPSSLRPLLAKIAETIFSSSDAPSHYLDSVLAASSISEKGENISGHFHKYWRKHGFEDVFIQNLKESSQYDREKFVLYYNDAKSDNPIDRWLEVDQRMYLCDDILTKVDIASMSVSLECRAPFLDHRIAEYANKISSKVKLKENRSKYLLRELAEREFALDLASRPKKGFSMPLGNWMRAELKDWTYSMVFDNKDIWSPYLKTEMIKRFWEEHQASKIDHSARLWSIASFGLGI